MSNTRDDADLAELGLEMMRAALETLRWQESATHARLDELVQRSIAIAAEGRFVPAVLLNQIGKLETQLAALLTLQRYAAPEPQPDDEGDDDGSDS